MSYTHLQCIIIFTIIIIGNYGQEFSIRTTGSGKEHCLLITSTLNSTFEDHTCFLPGILIIAMLHMPSLSFCH